jgi:hypothetical protein
VRISEFGSDRKSFPPSYLERVYSLPRPALWSDDFARWWHLDLAGLSDTDLAIELSRVWHRICAERPRPGHWLWQRRQAVFAERDRRAGRRVR